MRDQNDNVVIVRLRTYPMGIHTGIGDGRTISNSNRQRVSADADAALKIIRAIGVDTGGCNISSQSIWEWPSLSSR